MKKLLLYLIIIIPYVFAQPENPGPFQSGWMSVTLNRDGRNLNSIIYYPSYTEGNGAQIDTTNGPYPIIAFGHGFAMQNSYYISLFKHLASYGYIIIAPQFPDVVHLQLAYDLLYCINYIKNQNTNPSSRFFELVDITKTGLSGHSMGGGASLLAAANDSTIKVVAPLAAAETNPSVISVINRIKAVVYLITAQNDGITPPQNHQTPMYNNALPIKGMPILKGANHTKFMDTRIWDWTDPNGYLSAAQQLRLTRRYLTSIYNLFLKEDSSYFKYSFGSLAQNDTSIILQKELKPLKPRLFNLISPSDSSSIFQANINFTWNPTYSLNLYDVIKYKLIISQDSAFNNIYNTKDSLINSSFEYNINNSGNFFWKVIAYTSDSTFTESESFYLSVILTSTEAINQLYFDFKLENNYPNPFNPSTNISFALPEDGFVTLELFNFVGEKVATLISQEMKSGYHNYQLMADNYNLSSGVYFYKLTSNNFSSTKKLVLLK